MDSEEILQFIFAKWSLNVHSVALHTTVGKQHIFFAVFAMFVFGQKSWKPWLISMVIDIIKYACHQHILLGVVFMLLWL